MDILSPRDLYRLAPGSRPLSKRDAEAQHLIDTAAWINDPYLVGRGWFPVFALQGTTHKDSKTSERDGRHIVIMAPKGYGRSAPCVALLNSHCKLQRSWLMLGLWSDEAEAMLVGTKVPLQRWKGWQKEQSNLLLELPVLAKMDKALQRASMNSDVLFQLASRVQRSGFKDRNRPSARALLAAVAEEQRKDLRSVAFGMVAVARAGNLPSTNGERNIKGIRRPDALVQVGCAAYQAAVALSS